MLRWLRRTLLWLVGGFLALTVGAVLVMRWVPPVTSAFIVHGYYEVRETDV